MTLEELEKDLAVKRQHYGELYVSSVAKYSDESINAARIVYLNAVQAYHAKIRELMNDTEASDGNPPIQTT